MGMSEEEFYNTTPRYFYHRQQGWQNNIKREENWHKWYLTLHRASLGYLYNIQLPQIDRHDVQDLFPLPWDEEKKPEKLEDVKKWVEDHGLMRIPADQWIHRQTEKTDVINTQKS